MSAYAAMLLVIAACLVTALACILRPPGRVLRQLGVPIAPGGEERRAAEVRAARLLRQLLADGDYERAIARGYLDIPSPSIPDRLYRVPVVQGMVEVIESGVPTMRLCIVPTRWVPDPDVVIMHKLLIEGDEARYLRLANRFPTDLPRLTG